MKLIIDLQDPEIQRQLTTLIDQRVSALTAQRIEELFTDVLDTKMDRLTPQHLDFLAAKCITAMVEKQFSKPYGAPSPFDSTVAMVTERLVSEALRRKFPGGDFILPPTPSLHSAPLPPKS